MGGGRWSDDDWKNYTTKQSYQTKSTSQIFPQQTLHNDLSPYGIKGRESCDSADNPESNAIIIALDVTGSMANIIDEVARKSLNTLVTEIYARRPVSDPHVMIQGVGDVRAGDPIPLQITQFEADIRLVEQMEKLNIHQGGGGNGSESYMLSWFFAAHRTTIDCFEKRGRKGYLFTIGDDGPTPDLTAEELMRVLGPKPDGSAYDDVSRDELLDLVSRKYEVFHVTLNQGGTASSYVSQQWVELLGENAISLVDHTKLAEVIVSVMQIREGASKKQVVDSWDGTTSLVVAKAVAGLTQRQDTNSVVTL